MAYERVLHAGQRVCFCAQVSVNLARLTDEREMKNQLSEGDDLFQWIKLQAAKGAYSAQVIT